MPGPLFLILGPLVLASIALLLRRWQKVTILFGVGSILILVIGLIQISIDGGRGALGTDRWLVFGREIALSEPIWWTLLTTYIVMGVIFLISFVFVQSTIFIPLGIGLLSPLAAAIMVRPFVFGAVLLLMVASAVALLIQGERAGSTLASWRHLAIYALAPPLLLIAGWLLETDQSQLLRTAPTLFSIAFIILLVGFPFHIWVAPASTETDSLVLVVALGLVQLIVIFFCINLLRSNPIVLRSSQFSLFLRSSGIITLLLASILVLTAPSVGRLIGYLIMIDLGSTIYALALNSDGGLELSIKLILLRTLSLLLIATGLSMVNQITKKKDGNRPPATSVQSIYRGIGRTYPMATLILIYGALSMIGAPLTPGFSGKWALVSLASQQSTQGAIIIVIALTAGIVGLIRWVVKFWEPVPAEDFSEVTRSNGVRIAASLSLIMGIIITLSPEFVGELISRILVP
ncbi:MAG: hypothetical protein BMS9Abin02_1457 [Anaerolineae bacterium]|nr:MAG: hypothetical protein BMS9Abin02_1457 [Anaerolineae bacterium]